MFTIVDFHNGYYYIKLNEANPFLTTFNTSFGRFRFTRMPFGMIIAGDAFHCKLDTTFNNPDFCTGITNDRIIWGEEGGGDHDQNLAIPTCHKTAQYETELRQDTVQNKTS